MPKHLSHWQDPRDAEALAKLGLLTPEDYLHPTGGEVVSEVRDRIVYHYPPTLERPGYYLKVFRNPGANGCWSQILRGERPHSLAEVEQRRLAWLADRGFRAPRVAAWGALMRGWSERYSYLLTEDLTALTAFDTWLDSARDILDPGEFRRQRRSLLVGCADLLRRLHEAGFHHPYPYLRHFFVPVLSAGNRAGESSPEIAIIDVHSAVIGGPVGPASRARGLAECFLSSLKSPLSHTDRLRFLEAYCEGTVDRDLARRVLRRFDQKLRKHPNRYRWARERVDRAAFPTSSAVATK
jgi:hypothetical protein